MKKLLCFVLSVLIVFNSIICNVYAEDFSGSSTDYENPADAKPITESPEYQKVQKNIDTVMKTFLTAVIPEHASELWNNEISNMVESDSIKDNNVTTDGNYYYINANFIKNINQKVQENIHYLDHYKVYTPAHPMSEFPIEKARELYLSYYGKYNSLCNAVREFVNSDEFPSFFSDFISNNMCVVFPSINGYINLPFGYRKDCSGFASDAFLYVSGTNKVSAYKDDGVYNNLLSYRGSSTLFHFGDNNSLVLNLNDRTGDASTVIENLENSNYENSYGEPFRVFYSLNDLKAFLNNGRQYYAPNLPIANIRIPVTYVNNINTTDLPDFNFNTGSLVGKAEADVQADIDLALKNYLDHLIELNNAKPAPTSTPTPTKVPTPTKAPTSTPAPVTPITVTPTPVLPNVTASPTPPPEDFSSINKWLEQIYNWLLDFGDKHETFTEKICKYIDSTDGKLDQIIEAIDRLSQGDTTGDANGCKYDYTVLSEFMTQLWNESDKKFDKMVKLLEENNEYQQKIVDSLNQIKALLVADTVLDVFRNRSNETANKAKEKFPTSLPWDIALVVNAFSAPPKEPVIELPIKIESMHIDEKIVVDLSSEEWVKLAKTCRYLLSILFVLYMVHLSRKFFSKGDD